MTLTRRPSLLQILIDHAVVLVGLAALVGVPGSIIVAIVLLLSAR